MKKTFMLVSALAMIAMSVTVTSCKDKDDEPDSCTCYYDGEKEVIPGSELKKYGITCDELDREYRAEGGKCE